MFSHESAIKTLRNRSQKKIGCNTTLRLEYGNIVIKYHATDIITITPENKYILNCKGWRSGSTKLRLNKYTPVRIFQKNFEWFVYTNGQTITYHDGITFDSTGSISA